MNNKADEIKLLEEMDETIDNFKEICKNLILNKRIFFRNAEKDIKKAKKRLRG